MDVYKVKKETKEADLLSKFSMHSKFDELCDRYQQREKNELKKLTSEEAMNYIKSHLNFFKRKEGLAYKKEKIKVGDICYIDYGANYKQECGYFHMGLVLDIKDYKYLILPMTSSIKTFEKALFWKRNNLLPLPDTVNLEKQTTLFLNDARFINPARIIMRIAKIEKTSSEFLYIKKVFYNYIIG